MNVLLPIRRSCYSLAAILWHVGNKLLVSVQFPGVLVSDVLTPFFGSFVREAVFTVKKDCAPFPDLRERVLLEP